MDCIDGINKLPNNSVDCVITDPPYNISRETNFHTLGNRGTAMNYGEWDKDFDLVSWINLLPRILKSGANIIIFNDWKNLTTISEAMEKNGITPKRCLVLNKSNPAPFNRDRLFVNDVEFMVWGTFGKGWVFNRQHDNFERCIINTKVQHRKYHPTMKDLEVIKYLVEVLSNENQIILDPFIGSGTTAIACRELNRNCIGFEKNKTYHEIAERRLNQHKPQTTNRNHKITQTQND
jgi:site-specific DNA-methyltransferase (adenine-specific)